MSNSVHCKIKCCGCLNNENDLVDTKTSSSKHGHVTFN